MDQSAAPQRFQSVFIVSIYLYIFTMTTVTFDPQFTRLIVITVTSSLQIGKDARLRDILYSHLVLNLF